jgi:hypothetical protein
MRMPLTQTNENILFYPLNLFFISFDKPLMHAATRSEHEILIRYDIQAKMISYFRIESLRPCENVHNVRASHMHV